MKYLFSFTLLLCLPLSQKTVAQDILKFKDGDELKVKVQEITPQEIKYKRFDNLNGPLITILKNTVLSLQYENGLIEKLNETEPPLTPSSYVGSGSAVNPLTNENGFDVGDVVTADYYGSTYTGKVTSVNKNRLTAVVELDYNRKKQTVNRQFYELTLVEKATAPANNNQSPYAVGSTSNAPVPLTDQNSTELLIRGQNDAKRYYNAYRGAGTGTFFTAMILGPVFGLIPAAACSSTEPSQDRLNFQNPQLIRNMSYYTGYTHEAKRIKSRKVWGNYGIGSVISIVLAVAITSRR